MVPTVRIGRQVIQMVHSEETDTTAVIFEHFAPDDQLQRLIVSFRGTYSGTNIKTDVDTKQV